jgi:hypothetical protein
MLIDRPISTHEEEILEVISRHSNDDPYRLVRLQALTAQDLRAVSQPILEHLLEVYLTQEPINYPRIGWLIRRLAQLGAPGAFEYILRNLEKLTPVFGEVARYIMRASPNYTGNIAQAGEKLIVALRFPLVRRSEYLQIVLMDIFAHVPSLDHIYALTSRYDQMPPAVRRQVVRAATAANQSDWLRERKSEFHHGDPWLRRAIVAAAHNSRVMRPNIG